MNAMPGEARRERRWLEVAGKCRMESDAVPDIIDLWKAALKNGIPADWERRFREMDRARGRARHIRQKGA